MSCVNGEKDLDWHSCGAPLALCHAYEAFRPKDRNRCECSNQAF